MFTKNQTTAYVAIDHNSDSENQSIIEQSFIEDLSSAMNISIIQYTSKGEKLKTINSLQLNKHIRHRPQDRITE